ITQRGDSREGQSEIRPCPCSSSPWSRRLVLLEVEVIGGVGFGELLVGQEGPLQLQPQSQSRKT
ncbi:hypothetical protein MUK42_03966, partial [Musa troglodytarum]